LRGLGAAGLASELPEGEEALPPLRPWTSLSTPIEGPLGLLGEVADKAQWEFLIDSFGVDTSGRLAAMLPTAAILPGDLGEAFEPWSIDAHQGRANRWPDRFDPAATLAWLDNIQPARLFADPPAIERLLDMAGPGRLALNDILLWQPTRRAGFADRCRRAFGARVIEAVASSLSGFIASAGPAGSFVPAAETTFVEIVDEGGYPCGPGEPGRLLATALYSYHRPVIRHHVGLSAVWEDEGPRDPLSPDRRKFNLL
jgi:hypothetical protein